METIIKINMDNAAFEDGCDGYNELARILRRLSDELMDNGIRTKTLMDSNGNSTGIFVVKN
jgi:hypothetical protein